MATRTSDFPFTIMDVVELLRLHIRRRSPDYIYADCPLCGSQRGKLCINLTKNAWCSNCCGDSGGMLALYAKAQNVSNATAYSEICDALLMGGFAPDREAKRQERLQKEAVLSERAPTQVLHQTYSTLLGLLSLTPAHRKHLQEKRGFNDKQIATLGFKSTPPSYLCRSLTAKLIQLGCTVQGVPGFYMDDNGKWTVKFHHRTSGILIPYRNLDGMIQGLQIRLDRPLKKEGDPPDKGGAKYLWLASTSKTFGVSSGSPIHFVGDPCSRVSCCAGKSRRLERFAIPYSWMTSVPMPEVMNCFIGCAILVGERYGREKTSGPLHRTIQSGRSPTGTGIRDSGAPGTAEGPLYLHSHSPLHQLQGNAGVFVTSGPDPRGDRKTRAVHTRKAHWREPLLSYSARGRLY